MNIFSDIIKLPNYISSIPNYVIPKLTTQAIQEQPTNPTINRIIHDNQPSEPYNRATLQPINIPTAYIAPEPITNNISTTTTNNATTNNNTNNNNYNTLNNTYTTSTNNFATNNSYTTSNNISNVSNNTSISNVSNVSNISNIIRDDIKLSSEIRAIDTNLKAYQTQTNTNIEQTTTKLINLNNSNTALLTASNNVLNNNINDFKQQSLDLVNQNIALKRITENNNINRSYNSYPNNNFTIASTNSNNSNSFNPLMLLLPLVLLIKT